MLDFTKLDGAKKVLFKKDDIIIEQDERLDFIYYLTEGLIYRTVLDEKGDITIYDTKSGDNWLRSALGILYLFNDGVAYTNFIAKTDCICYKIPKESVMNIIKNDPVILYALVEISMDFYNKTIMLLQKKKEKSTVKALCQFLLDQAEYKNNKLAVRKACTNAEISRFLGVHQVTASRIIKCLKDEGIIVRCANGLTILDQVKLIDYANGDRKMKYS